MAPARVPVSIICVFNDLDVRQRCLDRSIEAHREEAPDTEYIPIDNVDNTFGSAGAALNHGASLANRDHLVFIHQDVYLHSLKRLEEAAAHLSTDGGFGLLGAAGVAADGHIHGYIRDRAVLLGQPTVEPVDVDSLDEVLFLSPRSLILREPLSKKPEMAWHSYAVEYGLRLKQLGFRVGAANIPLTHNSLTTNLDRLDVAHAAVARNHPDSLPVRTTCGTITTPEHWDPSRKFLRSQRWRYRWLRESLTIRSARRAADGSPFVLGDIRLDIDDVLPGGTNPPLEVLNLNSGDPGFTDEHPGPLRLLRRDEPIILSSGRIDALKAALEAWEPERSLLLTNITKQDLRVLTPRLPAGRHVIGVHEGIGFWILVTSGELPAHWRSRRSIPLGMGTVRF